MEVIRRNTDYALRIVTILAHNKESGQAISSRLLAKEAKVSYALTCKLLQKLQQDGIVKSIMGPKGGFILADLPEKVSFMDVVQSIQGPIRMNRCLLGDYTCPLKGKCPLHGKLADIQEEVSGHLRSATFRDAITGSEGKITGDYHE